MAIQLEEVADWYAYQVVSRCRGINAMIEVESFHFYI